MKVSGPTSSPRMARSITRICWWTGTFSFGYRGDEDQLSGVRTATQDRARCSVTWVRIRQVQSRDRLALSRFQRIVDTWSVGRSRRAESGQLSSSWQPASAAPPVTCTTQASTSERHSFGAAGRTDAGFRGRVAQLCGRLGADCLGSWVDSVSCGSGWRVQGAPGQAPRFTRRRVRVATLRSPAAPTCPGSRANFEPLFLSSTESALNSTVRAQGDHRRGARALAPGYHLYRTVYSTSASPSAFASTSYWMVLASNISYSALLATITASRERKRCSMTRTLTSSVL